MMMRIAAPVLFLLMSPLLAAHGNDAAAQSEVRDALANFVLAFDNLDWEKFRLSFSDDATVFYPRGFPQRSNGRALKSLSKSFSIRSGVGRLDLPTWTFSQRT
jgi:SnoaL-like domain